MLKHGFSKLIDKDYVWNLSDQDSIGAINTKFARAFDARITAGKKMDIKWVIFEVVRYGDARF